MQKKLFFNKLCKTKKKNHQKKEKNKNKKMHLNANGFKGLEKTFTNNRVQGA
jgi:hypothetical protein